MAINNHFKDKDIRKRLNNELLQQDFAAGERQAHTLTRYKEIAKGYALIESTAKEAFPQDSPIHKMIENNLKAIKEGKRDLYF